ncbi:MAG: MOSC domain-containing protein [Acidimicrobiia bacterium]|nr:MOSC domain-containing protein [Acidimicrobiia bacterium]
MAGASSKPVVVSVNVGRPRTTEWQGRKVRSGIWKTPVDGPVEVAGVNLAGDGQADRRVHGGPDKAVYAYSVEDYEWWAEALGKALPPATFGENLTTTGIDLTASFIGDRWRVGTAVFEVSKPRKPCYKLGMRMDDEEFPSRFEAAGRPGAYLRITEEGAISKGDAIHVDRAAQGARTIGSLLAQP